MLALDRDEGRLDGRDGAGCVLGKDTLPQQPVLVVAVDRSVSLGSAHTGRTHLRRPCAVSARLELAAQPAMCMLAAAQNDRTRDGVCLYLD